MRNCEDYGLLPTGERPSVSSNDDPVELALEVYYELGLLADRGKAREKFAQEINELQGLLPEACARRPYDIAMVPVLGELSLFRLTEVYDIVSARNGQSSTKVFKLLWTRYKADELNQGHKRLFEAQAILLDGDSSPPGEGLFFCEQSVKQQRRRIKDMSDAHQNEPTDISSLSIAGYIIRNVMQIVRGLPVMDLDSITTFPALKEQPIYEDDGKDEPCYYPTAHSLLNFRLKLHKSYGDASEHIGTRLVIRRAD